MLMTRYEYEEIPWQNKFMTVGAMAWRKTNSVPLNHNFKPANDRSRKINTAALRSLHLIPSQFRTKFFFNEVFIAV